MAALSAEQFDRDDGYEAEHSCSARWVNVVRDSRQAFPNQKPERSSVSPQGMSLALGTCFMTTTQFLQGWLVSMAGHQL
ncbi:MAG: hypothetical protein ACYDDF_12805 [Thermoplasmatota archaeon]